MELIIIFCGWILWLPIWIKYWRCYRVWVVGKLCLILVPTRYFENGLIELILSNFIASLLSLCVLPPVCFWLDFWRVIQQSLRFNFDVTVTVNPLTTRLICHIPLFLLICWVCFEWNVCRIHTSFFIIGCACIPSLLTLLSDYCLHLHSGIKSRLVSLLFLAKLGI